MAKKLSKAELRKLASDFDPPAIPNPKAHHTPPLTEGKRVRVTASLTPGQYATLQRFAEKRGLSLSAALGAAVDTIG